jgi:hypothetical protein
MRRLQFFYLKESKKKKGERKSGGSIDRPVPIDCGRIDGSILRLAEPENSEK